MYIANTSRVKIYTEKHHPDAVMMCIADGKPTLTESPNGQHRVYSMAVHVTVEQLEGMLAEARSAPFLRDVVKARAT